MFPKNERVSIFGFDFKEPAMYFLIPPFGTKKNEDKYQASRFYRHKRLENCTRFFTAMTIFYNLKMSNSSDFNFYVNRENDKESKYVFL